MIRRILAGFLAVAMMHMQLAWAAGQASNGFRIGQDSVNAGVGDMATVPPKYILSSTIGQAAVGGPLTGGGFILNSGLWVAGANGTLEQPVLKFSAANLTFANQILNTTSPTQSVTITNTGSEPLTIGSIAITGTHSTDFGQASSCPSIAPSATCTVSVTFTPTGLGARTASLTVTSNAASSPDNVTLTGTGIGVNSFLVTVVKTGTGSGTVTSSPAGINCAPTCAASFASGSTVTLTTTPAAGSVLGSWTGCDAVVGTTCTISALAGPRSVTATFNQSTQRAFVSATGNNANTATLCAVTAPCKTFAASGHGGRRQRRSGGAQYRAIRFGHPHPLDLAHRGAGGLRGHLGVCRQWRHHRFAQYQCRAARADDQRSGRCERDSGRYTGHGGEALDRKLRHRQLRERGWRGCLPSTHPHSYAWSTHSYATASMGYRLQAVRLP